jgi:hypothetical protein
MWGINQQNKGEISLGKRNKKGRLKLKASLL